MMIFGTSKQLFSKKINSGRNGGQVEFVKTEQVTVVRAFFSLLVSVIVALTLFLKFPYDC